MNQTPQAINTSYQVLDICPSEISFTKTNAFKSIEFELKQSHIKIPCVADTLQVKWVLSKTQASIFFDFYYNKIRTGADYFRFNQEVLDFIIPGIESSSRLFHFLSLDYQITNTGGTEDKYYTINAQLEMIP